MSSQNKGIRIFRLQRDEDTSGVSGVGVIAEGVILTNTKIVLSWLTVHKCVTIYDSMAEMIAVHGHDGRTKIIWEDEARP